MALDDEIKLENRKYCLLRKIERITDLSFFDNYITQEMKDDIDEELEDEAGEKEKIRDNSDNSSKELRQSKY